MKLSFKALSVIVFAVILCGFVTGCGHTLSGKYICVEEPNGYIIFHSDGKFEIYDTPVDVQEGKAPVQFELTIQGEYRWEASEKCYYLEFDIDLNEGGVPDLDHRVLMATPDKGSALIVHELVDGNKRGEMRLIKG